MYSPSSPPLLKKSQCGVGEGGKEGEMMRTVLILMIVTLVSEMQMMIQRMIAMMMRMVDMKIMHGECDE